jgi:hypothetical protein
MALMHLSVTDLPYSVNGIAGCVLTVSITNENGVAYTSLQGQNFEVRMFIDAGTEVELASVELLEFGKAPNLPNVRGLYAIDARARNISWSRSNPIFFFLRVHEDANHGQIIHPITDVSIALP